MTQLRRAQLLMVIITLLLTAAVLCVPCEASAAGCATACHARLWREQVVHAPVKSGECTSCHNPTGPSHPATKKAFTFTGDGAKLCYGCHDNMAAKKFVHGPVASGDCLACHDPHQSANRALLKEEGAALCLMCHNLKLDKKFKHGPVAGGICTPCHDPHQSNNRHLLKNAMPNLCYMCHSNIAAIVQDAKYLHGPVQDGDCMACHTPHASDYEQMLIKSFPKEFYLPYSPDNFALCFECHNKELPQDARTDQATGFRNGNFNLHYLHVNKQEKGRSCKVCHGPHGADQPKLIQEKVPGFGKWDIPIRYTVIDNGGTCVVGCHKPKTYDRMNPVEY